MLQHRTKKTLTTDPFGNTCEADEVSPEVEVGGGGCRTQVSTTRMGHRFVITTLNRALSQQYALGYDSYLHRKLTLITDQRSNNQDQSLKTS
jgi:ribosomal protein S9